MKVTGTVTTYEDIVVTCLYDEIKAGLPAAYLSKLRNVTDRAVRLAELQLAGEGCNGDFV